VRGGELDGDIVWWCDVAASGRGDAGGHRAELRLEVGGDRNHMCLIVQSSPLIVICEVAVDCSGSWTRHQVGPG
jgi:hypothetical protein